MDPQLQRRVQRYGWDRAVVAYEHGWRAQLEPAHVLMLNVLTLRPGDRVLDIACGTGLVSLRMAEAVDKEGVVVGTDISGEMVGAARRIAAERGVGNARFERSDAEALPFESGFFDAAACALGLMYVPDPVRALREMRRVLRPGGKAAAAVWGARHKCGWAEIFPITDARVASEVCPMFFHLGTQDTLADTFAAAGFTDIRAERLTTTLRYANADDALEAVFRGGPVALAYSRFDERTRRAVNGEYLDSIAAYRADDGYRLPGEFVITVALAPGPCVN
jgi:ubiquinone/menaquinone biosynthesis C-methylase UbiE